MMTTDPIITTSEIKVDLIQKVGGDHMVAAAAKASTCGADALRWADPSNAEHIGGLINYLLKNRHGTPFEHASLTFFVHAPAMVWWEWVRHRVGMSYNLESGRYSELKPVFWVPARDRKMATAADHKAARPSFVAVDDEKYHKTIGAMRRAYVVAWGSYQQMIDLGIANEVARSVLGFAIYYSGWVTCNPRSLMHFLSLRTHHPEATFPSRPQAEIEQAARACEEVFKAGWPITYAAFVKHGRVAP